VNIFRKLFGREPEKATAQVTQTPIQQTRNRQTEEQAVIVHLIGSGLPDETYQDYDLATLEDRLVKVVAHSESGEYDGNEFGEGETILYLYGPNAETLFSAIEGTLRGYPLCQNARVVIRQGPPGSPEREVIIGFQHTVAAAL
jgi:hypothetical protein